MREEIKELALTATATELNLLVQEVKDIKRSLSFEVTRLVALNRTYEEVLRKLPNQTWLDRRLNQLIAHILEEETQGPHDEEKDINKKLSSWN